MKKLFPLKAIYYNPTSYCNLKCRHCWISPPFEARSSYHPEELSITEINSLYDQAKVLGVKKTKLTGGEPFLRKNISEILNLIHEKNIGIQIETNGILINDEIAMLLKKIKKNDSSFFISVSLDGDRIAHDRQRGVKNSFDKTLKGIHILLKHDIHVQIICAINKKNQSKLMNVVDICKEVQANSLKLNFINSIERGKSMNKRGELLDVKDILKFNEIVKKINSSFNIYTNLPPAFHSIPEMVRGGRCGIFGILGVLANGDISFCGIGNRVPELIAGNVKLEPLKDIWEKGEVFQKLRNQIPEDLQGICGNCILKAICLGECRADAFYKTHTFNAPFEFCQTSFENNLFPKRWMIKK